MNIIISEMEIFYCSLISPSLFQWFSCHLFFSTSVLKGGLKLCVVWSEQKGGGGGGYVSRAGPRATCYVQLLCCHLIKKCSVRKEEETVI